MTDHSTLVARLRKAEITDALLLDLDRYLALDRHRRAAVDEWLDAEQLRTRRVVAVSVLDEGGRHVRIWAHASPRSKPTGRMLWDRQGESLHTLTYVFHADRPFPIAALGGSQLLDTGSFDACRSHRARRAEQNGDSVHVQ